MGPPPPGQALRVVTVPQDANVDAAAARFARQFVRVEIPAPRAGSDDQ